MELLAKGHSMIPTLPAESRIRVAPLTSLPAEGEILLYLSGNRLIGHRMKQLVADRNLVIFKGDNCLYSDVPVNPACILGRIITENA